MNVRHIRAAARIMLATFLTIAALSANATFSANAGPAIQDSGALQFSLTDSEGKTHTRKEWQQSKAVVLIFIGADCPISNGYAPEINRIYSAYASKEVTFYIVHSDPDMTRVDAAKHAAEYGYRFTVLLDPAQVLAKR